MKFNPTTDVPSNMVLVGASPVAPSDLERLEELMRIRDDAMDRFKALQKNTESLRLQYVQADKALDGRMIELSWKYGWNEASALVLDETQGMLFGLKPIVQDSDGS